MSFETGYTLRPLPTGFDNTSGVNTFKWESVSGSSSVEFLVIQTGNTLSFFDISSTTLSSLGFKSSIILSHYQPDVVFSFAAIQGNLVVVAGEDVITIISYNLDTNVVSASQQRILVRDLWGIQEANSQSENDPSYRTFQMDDHMYNLQNQSWGIPRTGPPTTASSDPSVIYNTDNGVFPSNSESVWTGITFQAGAGGAAPYERMFPALYEQRLGSDNKAAKGYYIIDLLRRGQSRATALQDNLAKYTGLLNITPAFPTDFTPGGAKVVTEFAGRVFYSGFSGEVINGDSRSPNLSSFIVFSKLVNNTPDIGKCYQVGDPTSRENSDIIDTDGGFLNISGAKNIIALEAMDTQLIVLAENGIWSISGGSYYGFSATNYKISKISSYGCISQLSIVTEGQRKFFWSKDSIYVIAKNQIGDLEVTSITQSTIQKLYNEILLTSKEKAMGIYDPANKKLRWLYKDIDEITNKELIFDLTLNAFYQHRISRINVNSPEIVSMFTSVSFGTFATAEPVYVGTEVVLSNSDVVTVSSIGRASGIQSVRYLTIVPGAVPSYTFSAYIDANFIDWKNADGIGADAKAFLETGEITGGDSAIAKQVPYLVMHFRRTESGTLDDVILNPSSCFIRSMWDWSNSNNSNKWSILFQAYRYKKVFIPTEPDNLFDTGFETIKTKNKIRGRGNAFSFRMETEALKDCRILGWVLTANANTIT